MLFQTSLMLAGLWTYIWQWGLAFIVMGGLLTAAVMTTSIPIIGPWLQPLRAHLAWAALAIALFMFGWSQGEKAGTARATAKQVVVEREVKSVVEEAIRPPSIKGWPDKWDREEH